MKSSIFNPSPSSSLPFSSVSWIREIGVGENARGKRGERALAMKNWGSRERKGVEESDRRRFKKISKDKDEHGQRGEEGSGVSTVGREEG